MQIFICSVSTGERKSYLETKILGFSISPCATSSGGNSLKRDKGILGDDHAFYIKLKYKEEKYDVLGFLYLTCTE